MLAILFGLALIPRLTSAVDWPQRRAPVFCADNLKARNVNARAIRGIGNAWPQIQTRVLQREVDGVQQTIVIAPEPRFAGKAVLEAGRDLLGSFSKFALEGIWDVSQLPERAMVGKSGAPKVLRRPVNEAAELIALDMAKWQVATEFVRRATQHFGGDTRTWNSKVWAWLDEKCANMKIVGPTRLVDPVDIKLAAVSLVDPDVISPERLVAFPLEAGHRTERLEKLNRMSLPVEIVYAFILYKLGNWAIQHPVPLTLGSASAFYLYAPRILNPFLRAQPWYQSIFPVATALLSAKDRTSVRNLLSIHDWSTPVLVLVTQVHVAGLVKRLEREGFAEIRAEAL